MRQKRELRQGYRGQKAHRPLGIGSENWVQPSGVRRERVLLLIFREGNRLKCWSPDFASLSAQPAHFGEQGDVEEDSLVADRPDRTSSYCPTGLRKLRQLLISLSLKCIITGGKARLLTPTSRIVMESK